MKSVFLVANSNAVSEVKSLYSYKRQPTWLLSFILCLQSTTFTLGNHIIRAETDELRLWAPDPRSDSPCICVIVAIQVIDVAQPICAAAYRPSYASSFLLASKPSNGQVACMKQPFYSYSWEWLHIKQSDKHMLRFLWTTILLYIDAARLVVLQGC